MGKYDTTQSSEELARKSLLSLIFSMTVEHETEKKDIIGATMSMLEIIHYPEVPGQLRQRTREGLESLMADLGQGESLSKVTQISDKTSPLGVFWWDMCAAKDEGGRTLLGCDKLDCIVKALSEGGRESRKSARKIIRSVCDDLPEGPGSTDHKISKEVDELMEEYSCARAKERVFAVGPLYVPEEQERGTGDEGDERPGAAGTSSDDPTGRLTQGPGAVGISSGDSTGRPTQDEAGEEAADEAAAGQSTQVKR